VHFKWVAKAELFRIVCIGWNMSLNRYIRLRRGDPGSIKRMMDDAERTLAEGSSLMIFPEGTRSPDGHLKAFKHGAFTLALRGRVPLLPIVVEGTANALPKRGFVLQGRHEIRVRVLPEIPYARSPASRSRRSPSACTRCSAASSASRPYGSTAPVARGARAERV
jgi:1-acyl-sn-glycerol-3-phosphate acyltransferase